LELIQLVDGLNLRKGAGPKFEHRLDVALRDLVRGRAGAGCRQLDDFIGRARTQSGVSLTHEESAQLVTAAAAIQMAVGCSSAPTAP
jgi:hypothetical protein